MPQVGAVLIAYGKLDIAEVHKAYGYDEGAVKERTKKDGYIFHCEERHWCYPFMQKFKNYDDLIYFVNLQTTISKKS